MSINLHSLSIALAIFGLSFSAIRCCQAADDWTTEEKLGESVYLTLHAIDWMQTRYIAKHPVCCVSDGQYQYYHEINPALGTHPSLDRVNAWFGMMAIAQPLIANALPRRWRDPWIAAGVVMELSLTEHNASIGIKMDLPKPRGSILIAPL